MKTISIKDNICIKGKLTTCGMKMLENFVPPYNATVVDKLVAAGLTIADGETDLALSSSSGENCLPLQDIMLKPTRGAISRYGLITATPSLEEITIIGERVDEVAELFNVIRGVDEKDSTTINVGDARPSVPKNQTIGALAGEYGSPLQNTISVEIPNIEQARTAYNIIAAAETFSNLARFDGMKFGHRSENAETLTELYENTRAEGFDYNTKKQIMLGAVVLSRQYRHLYYDRAIRARAKIAEEMNAAFEKCDVIVASLDENSGIIPNLTGLPAIAVGNVQIIGPKFSEELLFEIARNMM